MKKLREMPEDRFLKLFFAAFSACFLIAAVCMPDRRALFSGFFRILTQPCRVPTSYFAVGGYAATFFNMGLLGAICTLLFVLLRVPVDQTATLAFILTVSFGSWGIHPGNIWQTMLGVGLYALVRREKLAAHANAMLFSTGIAPLISELTLRYPDAGTVGFSAGGFFLALFVGLCIGFFLPAGLQNAPKVHHGFDLYSAAVPVGMTAFLLQGIFYKAMGVALPPDTDPEALAVGSRMIVNSFCCALFGLCIAFGLLFGGTPKKYWAFVRSGDPSGSTAGRYGSGVMLLNVGIYGLFILAYYNLVGAGFNGVTFGVIICMLSCANSGNHPGNVAPIFGGYLLAAFGFSLLSRLTGGNFTQAIHAQSILVGVCYASGLTPIVNRYGWQYGLLGGVLHYCLVTTAPYLHGSFCLYNGGFTSALVCLLYVPQLQRFCKLKKRYLNAHGEESIVP